MSRTTAQLASGDIDEWWLIRPVGQVLAIWRITVHASMGVKGAQNLPTQGLG